MKRTQSRRSRAAVLAAVALGAMSISGVGPIKAAKAEKIEKKKVEPDADRLLREMGDYLGGLPSFKVRSASTDEIETKEGQKVQVAAESVLAVARPDRLRSEQIGDRRGMALSYDGKTVTLVCKTDNTYGQVPAPPTLDAMMDLVRKKYGLDAPGADLLYSKPYDGLMEQVTSGRFLGQETISGVTANHLAFRGKDVDWQIWIQDGKEPLPLRYVITTKSLKSQPQFTVQLSNWEPRWKPANDAPEFAPPKDAKRVDNLPTSCGAVAPPTQKK
jgi:hypothetical protein